jgi:hypothetical protein
LDDDECRRLFERGQGETESLVALGEIEAPGDYLRYRGGIYPVDDFSSSWAMADGSGLPNMAHEWDGYLFTSPYSGVLIKYTGEHTVTLAAFIVAATSPGAGQHNQIPGGEREIMGDGYVPIPESVTGVIDKDGVEWRRTDVAEWRYRGSGRCLAEGFFVAKHGPVTPSRVKVSGVDVPAALVPHGADTIVPGMRRPIADPDGKTWDYYVVAWTEQRAIVAYVHYSNGHTESLIGDGQLKFLG